MITYLPAPVYTPPPSMEVVPPKVMGFLSGRGWLYQLTENKYWFYRPGQSMTEYYPWSEAMCMEMMEAFITLETA